MEKNFGIEQLYCYCEQPDMYQEESGAHWCHECGGLVPEEQVKEMTRFCTCETVPDTHIKKDKDGPPIFKCSGCKKELNPNREIRSAFEIALELQEKGKGSTKLLGPAVVMCPKCGHHDWSPHNGDIDHFVGLLQKQYKLICSRCRGSAVVPDEWKGMIK